MSLPFTVWKIRYVNNNTQKKLKSWYLFIYLYNIFFFTLPDLIVSYVAPITSLNLSATKFLLTYQRMHGLQKLL